jgi:hypothetical protein
MRGCERHANVHCEEKVTREPDQVSTVEEVLERVCEAWLALA